MDVDECILYGCKTINAVIMRHVFFHFHWFHGIAGWLVLFSFKFSRSRHEMTYVMFCFYYFSATLFQFLLVLMSKFFLFVVGGRDVDIYTFVKKSPSFGVR